MATSGSWFRPCLLLFVMVSTLAMAACASASRLPPNVLQAGQLDIQLPPGWKVVHNTAIAPSEPGSGAVAAGVGVSTTIPLDKQNPATEFFQATGVFSSCLKGLGVTFIGAPDPQNPNSPANDPNYLKSLETCAAQSHILQAIKDFQTAQDNLTPAQIRQQNQGYLRWRTCMIGRGWTIPAPVPDSKGRLFSLGSNGTGPQLQPPPGESVLDSPDIQDCLQRAQLGGATGSS